MVERSQIMHQSSLTDMPVHKYIPMDKLDLIEPNQVRLLYYHNPSRFCVYLRQRINSHATFQIELQRAMQNYQSTATAISYQRYQAVAAQDHHAVWHRAIVLDVNRNSTDVVVYFVDVGQEENLSISNIRPLPNEFTRHPALAIPCRLYGITPLRGQLTWNNDDRVHERFNDLMTSNVNCKVCEIQEQICYDVDIDIPQVGDLGTYLFEQNLVSRINMRTTQTPQQTGEKIPPGFSALNRLLPKPTVQQSPSLSTFNDTSSEISTLSPQDGSYTITHVYSATEFYGHSQKREKELDALQTHLETVYNTNNTNDQSLSVHLLMEGVPCVIQQGDKYHRVVIKHRDSESRVLVKLIDRGDELIVDTSELLQLERKYFTIPAFAQPFRLFNYDETHSTPNITRKLKRLILNHRVHITLHPPAINRFHPVEIKLIDNRSVNEILLSNDINLIVAPPAPPPVKSVEVPQRTNEELPTPQKLLTAPPPPQPSSSRFMPNEQPSRFSRVQQQQQPEGSNSPTNGIQPLMSGQNHAPKREFSMDRNRNNNDNREGRNDFRDDNTGQRPTGGFNRHSGEERTGGGFNHHSGEERTGGGFNRSSGDERTGGGFNRNSGDERTGGGFNRNSGDERTGGGFNRPNGDERTGRGFNRNSGDERTGGGFNRNSGDERTGGGFNRPNGDENNGPRSTGFNRNVGFADRGSRNGFSDRNFEDGHENNGPRRGGWSDRGARNGDFQDRNNRPRDNQDDDNNPRFRNRGAFNGDRRGRGSSSFQNNYDRENDGDNPRRGGRGGPRGGRGGYGDRGNRGGGDRGRFGGRSTENGFHTPSDTIDSTKTFSGWPNNKSTTTSRFEAGTTFIENVIPKESCQFVISHIEKVDDFFIQLISKENELLELNETLQKEYKDGSEVNLGSLEINQACLAKSSDNCWYRAIVLSKGLIKIKVRFIDFGDTIDVDVKTIRQLAKKFCSIPPYAYRCTLKNVEFNSNIKTDDITQKCISQRFDGKIEKIPSENNKYYLQSNNFEKLMSDINAIKLKPEVKHIPCLIVYIDHDKHLFYVQDDDDTMEKIRNEITTDDDLSPNDIQISSMVISTYEDDPYRAIIQEDLGDNVCVYFVDYGNKNTCSKDSLKKCSEQLKSYPHQAKCCQLSDISINDLDQVYKQLDEYIEYEKADYVIINQDNKGLLNVQLYIDDQCFNERFSNDTSIDINDQSSTTTATTVKEQERPMITTGKRNNEEILSPTGNSSTTSMSIKRQKSESEPEVNSNKSYEAILTYIDQAKSIVYLQLIPESESNLKRIGELIEAAVEENQHNPSYDIDDYVIAQFSDDKDYYRARIQSYSPSTDTYVVYFIDYGNIDENVSKENIYSYSNELKEIEAQVHEYTVDNLASIKDKLNKLVEFHFIDELNSKIHIKTDSNEQEQQPPQQPKTFTANISGTNKDSFYIHILPDTDALICEMDELLQSHSHEHKQTNQWNIDELCIVHDSEKNQYFRGKILSITNDQKYAVQYIDYGYIVSHISNENLYLLTDNDLIERKPLARQCRLHGVNDDNQLKAINEIIQYILPTERVTITVDNDQTDQCMYVMLFRENNETVNDRYAKETDIDTMKNYPSRDSSDSAIDTSNDQQVTSPIGIPQAESTHQFGDTTNLTVSQINQTIDFGENDPSSSSSNLTIIDEQ